MTSWRKVRFESALFLEDGSLAGPGSRIIPEKDRFDPCPSSTYSLFTIHYLPARRERDPGPKGKARCGAWLGAQAFPERPDSDNLIFPFCVGAPERRGRGGRNPTASPKAEQCAPAQGEALPM